MQSYEIDNIINELMEEGFDLNTVNQVNKALNNGFDEMKKIRVHVQASSVRQVNEAYNKFYKEQLSPGNLISVQKALVEAINNDFPIEYFVDKYHNPELLLLMIEDLKNGIDITHYLNKEDTKDYSEEKIKMLRRLTTKGIFSKIDKENIEYIKKARLNNNDVENIIRANDIEMLKDFLELFKQNYDSQKSYLLSILKKEHPEFVDPLRKSSAKFIEKATNILNDCVDKDKKETLLKIKHHLSKFDESELEKLLKLKIEDEDLKLFDTNFNTWTIITILKDKKDYDMSLIDFFSTYKLSLTPYELKNLTKILAEMDKDKVLEKFTQEIDNNPECSYEDLEQIILGIKSGIDISLYITDEEQEYPYDYTYKKYLRLILEYNEKHKENPIELEEIVDHNGEKGINIYDNGNIEELCELLKNDINIIPFLEADADTISTILYNKDTYHLNDKQVSLILDYEKFDPSEDNLEFLMQITSDGYQILNEEEIFQKSISTYKEISKIRDYDDFSKEIIDNKLTEENSIQLLNALKQYQRATGIFKEICKENILHEYFFKLGPEIEKMSNEKLEIILKDIKNGVDPNQYTNVELSVKQMKLLSEMNDIAKTSYSEYIKKECQNALVKICKDSYSEEQLEHIKQRVIQGKDITKYKPEYNVEQMKLYDNWHDVSYIYNFFLYNLSEKIDNEICKKVREGYVKLDKSLPIEQQKEIFKNVQKDALNSIVENPEIDMDTKIFIYKLIDRLEVKEKEPENLTR